NPLRTSSRFASSTALRSSGSSIGSSESQKPPPSRATARNVITPRSSVPSVIAYNVRIARIWGHRKLSVPLLRNAIQVVNFPCFHKLCRRVLWRNVPLRRPKKFVAHQNFLIGGGGKRRRKEVD